ncbi:Ribonuclease II, chloroplastic/mitochondrial-like protein [Drosera capensis]
MIAAMKTTMTSTTTTAILHSAAAPPLPTTPPRFLPAQLQRSERPRFHPCSALKFRSDSSRGTHGCVRFCSCSVRGIVECVVRAVESGWRSSGRVVRVRVANRVELVKSGEVGEKVVKQELREGLLLEFKKDAERVLLAVLRKPDGKKNWIVYDQNGVTSSIKPQQITYIVPGIENFNRTKISEFIRKAEEKMDSSLLEFAWVELLEKNKSVTVEELAQMIFGSAEPLESYCAHLLLSKDDIYFSTLNNRGFYSVFAPRPAAQVDKLLQRKFAREAAKKELQEFAQLLKSCRAMPLQGKPPKNSWMTEERIWYRIKSLEAYAIDDCEDDEQEKTAEMILHAMKLSKQASSALKLLIDIGYFPVHVDIEVLRLNIPTEHPQEVLAAAEELLSDPTDLDKEDRKDLTHLKVYAIDVDEADELDDALSATRLQDGKIKVWIHVADPTCLVQPGSLLDIEARSRGTSFFLPTATYPMFPERLAMNEMSLQQGKVCNVVTVSVVLHSDGSIAEYSVDNAIIRPTYMLVYESADELIYLNLEEEAELRILSEAAMRRFRWRCEHGACDVSLLEGRIKVSNPDDPEPEINLYLEDRDAPSMRLVSEMMILCGEVIADFGWVNLIPLPYRGQPQSDTKLSSFYHFPEGPARDSAMCKVMRAAEYDFMNPIHHGALGIPGYVQFTSPIRRYIDLLAHYQVKAFLRGKEPPFSAGQLESITSLVTMNFKMSKKLYHSSLRYWMLEYLRRQPKEKYFRAVILRFIKDRNAALLLVEVGFQASAVVSHGVKIGDVILVKVVRAHPREDYLSLEEV